jgi:hypothetical protein
MLFFWDMILHHRAISSICSCGTSGIDYPLTHHKVESSKQFSYFFLSSAAVTVVLLKLQVF